MNHFFQIQLCKELEELYVKDMKQISEIAGKTLNSRPWHESRVMDHMTHV